MNNQNKFNLGDRKSVNQELKSISTHNQDKIAQIYMENMLEDPSLYEYDDYLDNKKQQKKQQKPTIIQKEKQQQQPRYLSGILEQAQRRKLEQQAIQVRQNAKEVQGSAEIYIGEAYKKQLEEVQKYNKITQLSEKLNEKQKEDNKIGIMKTLFDQNQFQGGNREMGSKTVDQYKIIEAEVERQVEQERQQQLEQQQKLKEQQLLQEEQHKKEIEEQQQKEQQKLKSKSRSRSKSKEKEKQISREERLNLYKQRYQDRKNQK